MKRCGEEEDGMGDAGRRVHDSNGLLYLPQDGVERGESTRCVLVVHSPRPSCRTLGDGFHPARLIRSCSLTRHPNFVRAAYAQPPGQGGKSQYAPPTGAPPSLPQGRPGGGAFERRRSSKSRFRAYEIIVLTRSLRRLLLRSSAWPSSRPPARLPPATAATRLRPAPAAAATVRPATAVRRRRIRSAAPATAAVRCACGSASSLGRRERHV